MVRFEPSVNGLDGVMHRGLDYGQIQEHDRAGTRRGRRDQGLHGNAIPIGHGIGVNSSRPTYTTCH